MNNQITNLKKTTLRKASLLSLLLVCLAFLPHIISAQKAAKVNKIEILTQASATYSDGTNNFSTVSDQKRIVPIHPHNFSIKTEEKSRICKIPTVTRFFVGD